MEDINTLFSRSYFHKKTGSFRALNKPKLKRWLLLESPLYLSIIAHFELFCKCLQLVHVHCFDRIPQGKTVIFERIDI